MYKILFTLLALFWVSEAHAQQPVCYQVPNQAACQAVSVGTPLPVNASVSASIAGFTPSPSGARGTPIAVATSDSSGTLPTGAVVLVTNAGANPMYCNVNGVAATTSDQEIASGGGWFAFTIPAAVTTLHCIATGSSTTANMVGGSGIPTGAAGAPNVSVAGTTSNATSGVATSSTNQATVAYTYGFNGTTWDQLQVDGSKNLKIAGTVTANAGTGNFTVVNGGTFATQAAQSGTWNITNISGTVSLPTGAATSANQSTMISSLASIATNTSTPLAGVTTAQTSAAASSLVAKASAGSVVSISGSAVNGSYIMLFNATTAPADGAVTPLKCWGPMAAAGPFSLAWGIGPVLTMSTGITVVSSSTGCFTKTATNAAFLSVEYQ